jgi:hypothetical protein
MFTSAILDLRLNPAWEPGRLTADAFSWPRAGTDPELPMRVIAARVPARSFAEAGSPVVTPGDIDGGSGGVRRRSKRYQGSVYQIGAELRPGDVAVPRTGLGPALLVSERLRGALLSARFSAIRPVEPDLGMWLWAVISSESGRRMRANLSQGSAVPSVEASALLDATVPLPPEQRLHRLRDGLREIHRSTFIDEDEPVETWWTTADLRAAEWRIAMATPDPSILMAGEPLGDYCGEIVRGKPTRELAIEIEAPGHLPVADVSMIGGKPPRRWVPEEAGNPRIGVRGDLLVAGLGNLPHAWIADRPVAVDFHVLLLRLRNPEFGPALARYLNGQDAFQIRQLLVSGSPIPQLSVRDLARMPVPASVLEEAAEPAMALPLSERLEQVLWQD